MLRRLLILYIATSLAAMTASIIVGISAADSATIFESPLNAWIDRHFWPAFAVMVAMIIGFIAGIVGMYRYKVWGRSLSAFIFLVGLGFTFVEGIVETGPEAVLYTVSNILWGAVLASAYLSPDAARFTKARPHGL